MRRIASHVAFNPMSVVEMSERVENVMRAYCACESTQRVLDYLTSVRNRNPHSH